LLKSVPDCVQPNPVLLNCGWQQSYRTADHPHTSIASSTRNTSRITIRAPHRYLK
jgi:hypothetical protein